MPQRFPPLGVPLDAEHFVVWKWRLRNTLRYRGLLKHIGEYFLPESETRGDIQEYMVSYMTNGVRYWLVWNG
jgi:hypothetical protein